MGALNGHSNARGVLDIMRAMSLGGETGGVRLLSPETIDLVFEEQANGTDVVLGQPLRFGIGYGLTPSGGIPYLPEGRVCFYDGLR